MTDANLGLYTFNGSEKKWEKLNKLYFFLDSLKVDNKTKEKIRLIYEYAEILHHGQYRKDGSMYFEHPIEVAKILSEIGGQNPKSIIIALLHDVIEDTEIEHDILCELFGNKIADAVEMISKKPWINYIEGEKKVQKKTRSITNSVKKSIKSLFLQNDFPIIVDLGHFYDLLSNYEELLYKANRPYIHFYMIINGEKDEEIQKIVEKCKTLCKKHKKKMLLTKKQKVTPDYSHIKKEDIIIARELRDEDYFGHMDDLDNDTLNVKFADRIHNLRTIYSLSHVDIKRKVKETKKYFLGVARKRNIKAYTILVQELTKIEAYLYSKETSEKH